MTHASLFIRKTQLKMNRTIKFRGKLIDGGRWVYGDLISFGDERWINCNGVEKISDTMVVFNARAVDPETVGQFTGLLDKDGKEIWEGDILQTWFEDLVEQNGGVWHRMHVVFTKEKGFALWGHRVVIEDAETLQEMLEWKHWKIINNIHDNPELLNTETK